MSSPTPGNVESQSSRKSERTTIVPGLVTSPHGISITMDAENARMSTSQGEIQPVVRPRKRTVHAESDEDDDKPTALDYKASVTNFRRLSAKRVQASSKSDRARTPSPPSGKPREDIKAASPRRVIKRMTQGQNHERSLRDTFFLSLIYSLSFSRDIVVGTEERDVIIVSLLRAIECWKESNAPFFLASGAFESPPRRLQKLEFAIFTASRSTSILD